MANTDRICRKGFILAPSPTDGELVPFFLQVRENDIIWNEASAPELINDDYQMSLEKSYSRMDECWTYKSGDWIVDYHANGIATLSTRLYINRDFGFINQNTLQAYLLLPVPLKDDARLLMDSTIFSSTNAIRSSNITLNPVNTAEKVVQQCELTLYNFTTLFSPSFRNDEESYINIRITGNGTRGIATGPM